MRSKIYFNIFLKNIFGLSCLFLAFGATAQSVDPSAYNMLQWRMIGPFRGGRTVGAGRVTKILK